MALLLWGDQGAPPQLGDALDDAARHSGAYQQPPAGPALLQHLLAQQQQLPAEKEQQAQRRRLSQGGNSSLGESCEQAQGQQGQQGPGEKGLFALQQEAKPHQAYWGSSMQEPKW